MAKSKLCFSWIPYFGALDLLNYAKPVEDPLIKVVA
jgi:hypothetical protein